MHTYDTAMLAVFRNFIRQALDLEQGGIEVYGCKVYAPIDLPGAYIAKFDLAGSRPSQTLSYLPEPITEGSRELFAHAVATLENAERLNTFELLEALRDLLDVVEGRTEGGFLQYTRTLSEQDIAKALNAPDPAAVNPGVQPLNAPVDVSLVMLDILSGFYSHYFDEPKEDQTYEAYAFSADPYSTMISLNYGHDRTSVIFIVSRDPEYNNPALDKAIEAYLAIRAVRNNRMEAYNAVDGAFKRLSIEETFERLGRVLAAERESGITVWQPLTIGPVTEVVREALAEFAPDDSDLQDEQAGEPLSATADPDPLETIFDRVLKAFMQRENKDTTAFRGSLLESEIMNFEILTHKHYPQVGLVIVRTPYLENVAGMWSLFCPDSGTLSIVLPELYTFINERKLFTTEPSLPLSESSVFTQLCAEDCERKLMEIKEHLRRNEGLLCERLKSREIDTPIAQNLGRIQDCADRKRLH